MPDGRNHQGFNCLMTSHHLSTIIMIFPSIQFNQQKILKNATASLNWAVCCCFLCASKQSQAWINCWIAHCRTTHSPCHLLPKKYCWMKSSFFGAKNAKKIDCHKLFVPSLFADGMVMAVFFSKIEISTICEWLNVLFERNFWP